MLDNGEVVVICMIAPRVSQFGNDSLEVGQQCGNDVESLIAF